jgi:mRNA interferase YafQ
MRELQPTTQYRKDLKRFKNKPKKLDALRTILNFLKEGLPIPAEYFPHKLYGNYNGCMECHIEGDFLLIWVDEVNNIIELVRLGSHAELFGK